MCKCSELRATRTAGNQKKCSNYSKLRISRIQVDRQIHPSYVNIRLIGSKILWFGTIVSEILSEICEDPTYTSPTYARFTVHDKHPDRMGSGRHQFFTYSFETIPCRASGRHRIGLCYVVDHTSLFYGCIWYCWYLIVQYQCVWHLNIVGLARKWYIKTIFIHEGLSMCSIPPLDINPAFKHYTTEMCSMYTVEYGFPWDYPR